MTAQTVNLDDLIDTRAELIKKIKESLTQNEIKFLLSWKNKKPEWELLGIEGIENLPGVRRRLINLEQLKGEKHKQAYEKLERYILS
jgi:hypothetical protein